MDCLVHHWGDHSNSQVDEQQWSTAILICRWNNLIWSRSPQLGFKGNQWIEKIDTLVDPKSLTILQHLQLGYPVDGGNQVVKHTILYKFVYMITKRVSCK